MTKVDMSSYRTGAGSFKFKNIGDTLAGTITRIREPHERKDQFSGEMETVMVIEVETGEGESWSIWPRLNPPSQMGRTLADAVASHDGVAEGGYLTVSYSEDKALDGKPAPMKVYTVAYVAPAAEPVPVDDGEKF